MAKRWYVVHAFSGFENQVKRALIELIARAGLEDRFGEVLVPMEEVVEMRAGQMRKSERKFFLVYVLVQLATRAEVNIPQIVTARNSEERRDGKGGVSTSRFRSLP